MSAGENQAKARIKDIATVKSGSGFPNRLQGGRSLQYPFFKVGDMNLKGNEVEMREETNSISEETRTAIGATAFTPGTVIFPKVGGAIATNKKRLIVRPSCIDNNLMGVMPDTSKILPYLLYYFFQARDLSDFANDAGLPSIKQTTVEDWVFGFLPPLPEQQRIVALLDDAFAGLATAKANAERNLENARAIFESRLAAVFNQRGEGWIEMPLADLCIVDWGNTDLTKRAYVKGGQFLAVSAAGCDGRIGHKEHDKYTPVLSAIGAQCGRMFLPEEDFTAIKNTITLTPKEGMCTGSFLYRLLTHVELPKRGAAQPFISKGDIQEFRVVVPESLGVQQEIEASLACMEAETQHLTHLYERKLAALEELKKSLLQQAFNGEL